MPNSKFLGLYRQADFRTRAVEDSEDMIIEGYFVVFDQPYIMGDWGEEYVARGAFDGCDMTDVRALIDHRPELVLGRNTANTLTLSIDDTGLFGSIRVNSRDTDAVNLHARVQRGDVNQASFGFDEGEVTYTDLADGRVRRTINHVSKLYEVSVCTFPAYEQTYVSARSAAAEDVRKAVENRRREKLKRRFRHHER